MDALICLPIGNRLMNRSRRRSFVAAGTAVSSSVLILSKKKTIPYSSSKSIHKTYLYLCDSTLLNQSVVSLIQCASSSHEEHNHCQNNLDHHHHHHHHHHHCCGGGSSELSNSQKAVVNFAKSIGWADLAGFLRENLLLCCCSVALLLCAAVCPYLAPKSDVKLLQNAFISIAFPIVGVSAGLDAAIDIAAGTVNIHVLMALAAFASVFMGNAIEGGLLLAMFNLAHIAEEYFTSRSLVDVKELKDGHPDFALVVEMKGDTLPHFSDLAYKQVALPDVEIGSYVLVRAGESVPVDGKVSQGRSTITIEHLTGEAKPVEMKVGDRIPGGARNLDGMMIVKATKTWNESTLNRIVQLTEEAQLNKPKLQRWLDEFGEHYSKVVVALSIGIAILGPFLFKWPFIGTSVCRGSVYRALGFMVAASPCALAVAPLAYATAISACARIEPIHGHRGVFRSKGACCMPNCEKEALAVAAAMEKGTTHPIGRAVVDHSMGKDLPSMSIENFESLPGRGLYATLAGVESGTRNGKPLKASLGSVEYIASLFNSEDESKKIKEAVSTSAFGSDLRHAVLSVNSKVTLFHFEDKPRPGVASVISELKDHGKLRVMMLTGDHESSASRVASTVGISEVYSNLKPEDKLNQVKNLSRGGGLIMVGDGINDAPALAAATVGIVLAQRASGTAVAVADVLLLRDDISSVPFCIAKARQTTILVKQSVALALACIILAALPSVLGFLPLWLTVLLHEGGTLFVCLNSIRALNNPTWSWKQDFKAFKSSLARLLRRQPISNTVQAITL
ncbi:probable cadmium/zinc-transporting ATPase HMA1, chloroplastic isoform X2 [Papaver somniferum]|uniref:probable cadmium/zinc-transporting ATPase HMA1, chloroplastic isoform X2 n=1 Tax=Papaver somniferum TaxID=3469 RepID=UPI000E6F8A51|nr:probable cadmium/zinc-transporting ATPase HMA1, chloroplastic isoform X2 [Papaver somniferum]